MIADLVRDLLWARCRVLVVAGHRVDVAMPYLLLCADTPGAPNLPDVARPLEREHRYVQDDLGWAPREACMDGSLHVEGECCGHRACTRLYPRGGGSLCRGRVHVQGVYGGLMELCERCPGDADDWSPAGSYKVVDGDCVPW